MARSSEGRLVRLSCQGKGGEVGETNLSGAGKARWQRAGKGDGEAKQVALCILTRSTLREVGGFLVPFLRLLSSLIFD